MTPGSNLLIQALRMIQPQPFDYYRATGRAKNAQYREIVTYAKRVEVWGSPQPLSSVRVQQMGLKATKNYLVFYASENFATPTREGPADLIQFNGRRYETVDGTSWIAQDGWEGVVAVEVGPAGPVEGVENGD